MDQLPLEIKHIIAQWTGEHESKKTLQVLSQVNREWNKIASSVLYRHLIIRLPASGETPHKLLLPPDTRSVLTQVKTLSLVAGRNPHQPGVHNLSDILEGVRLGLASNAVSRVGDYNKGDWTLITDLIRQLPSLHNANLFILNGGPVELFETFSHYHPTCRVSIFSTEPWVSVGPHWALSPMLHGLHLTAIENERSRLYFEHPDQLLKKFILHSPKIKEVSLQIVGAHNVAGPPPNYNQGIVVEEGSAPSLKLQKLIWPLSSEMTTGQFQEWQRITDFSLLKVWSIGCVEDSALLRSIVDIHPFQHLAQLTLALIESKGDENLEFRRAAEEMFKSLPPLTYLWLLGSYTPAFLNHGVLVKHGPTLLELKLYKRPERMPVRHDMRRLWRKLGRKRTAPVFSSDDISELAGRCPSLQKLRLCAQRPQGLGTDVWNAFGRFRHLEELDLTLKCSPEMDTNMMPVPLRELSEFEKGVVECSFTCRRWFIRDCIINSSINESLAKAFFTHIRTCQEVKRFANLVIRPLCTPAPGDHFWNHLALTWIIKVDPLTGLHAKSSKPSKTSVPTPETSFEAEMLSIVQSI